MSMRAGDEPVPSHRLVKRLGKGGFGEVWQATGPGGTAVALKFVGLSGREGHKEFRAIERIKLIRHANLTPITGIWILDQEGNVLTDPLPRERGGANPKDRLPALNPAAELVVAMGLGDKDLFKLLKEHQAAGGAGIPPLELLDYLDDAAKALDFLHSPIHDLGSGPTAIQHCDIKPQNIMLVGTAAQVVDFGLARALATTMASRSRVDGTLAYIAPECIDGNPSRSTDQYSLAISYFQLRTGELPFDTESFAAVMAAHREGKLNLDRLPQSERQVVKKATALDPDGRFASVREMVDNLRDAYCGRRGSSGSNQQWIASGARAPSDAQPAANAASEPAPKPVPEHAVGTIAPIHGDQLDGDIAEAGVAVQGDTSPGKAEARETPHSRDALPAPSAKSVALGSSRRRRRLTMTLAGLVAVGLIGVVYFCTLPDPADDSGPNSDRSRRVSQSSESDDEKRTSKALAAGDSRPAVESADESAEEPVAENHAPNLEMGKLDPAKPVSGQTVIVELTATDADGDTLRYEYRTSEQGAWQPAPDARIELTNVAQGTLHLWARALDSEEIASEIVSGSWQVKPANRPPTMQIVATVPEEPKAGEPFTIRVKGSDPDGDVLRMEYREQLPSGWKLIDGGALTLATPSAGKLELAFRAVDPLGGASEILERSWTVTATDHLTNTLDMELVLIPAGEFTMGSPPGEEGHQNNETQHRVRITAPFHMSVHEVTVGQFRGFVEGDDYSTDAEKDGQGGWGWDEAKSEFAQKPEFTWRNPGFTQDDTHPVVNVSWNDAVAFCNWLSAKEGKQACYRLQANDVMVTKANGYRLPTEAEWEYACRAGTTSAYQHGDDPEGLAKVANAADGTAKAKFPSWSWTITAKDGFIFTAPVGSFKANPFGLYDMHGNVWEWCQDWYAEYGGDADDPVGPVGPGAGVSRVIRGGGWDDLASFCRCAFRYHFTPSDRRSHLGFRVVLCR